MNSYLIIQRKRLIIPAPPINQRFRYPFLIIQEVNVAVPDVRPHTIPYTYIINAVFNILQTNTVTRQVLENQQVYM